MVPASNAEETAREFATQFAHESFEDAAGSLSDAGREAVVESFPDGFPGEPEEAEDTLEQYWRGLYGQYGAFETVGDVAVTEGEGDEDSANVEVAVQLVFENGSEAATVQVDEDGVAGLSFDPTYEEPMYADHEAFVEHDVTVDAGDVELDGVLAVPKGDGPFPGVLLVHGAGIHDPDGADGASKILRDFAHGLASEGVAVLRYEKRLLDHEVADEDFTLDAVVTDDAVAAVDELAAPDAVDAERLFVAGHSQGGMAAPRIAEQYGGVAGVVVLDSLADPMLDPDDMAFMRYEFEPDGDLSEEQEAQLDADRETARRIVEGDFEDDETLWGRPGTWHRSVADCDPVATLGRLDRPAFVAKNSRADEERQPELAAWLQSQFEQWQTADLPGGSRVKYYEGLDHFFQEGFTPWTPLCLYFGGNVADYVVEDVTAWIHDVAGE